MRVRITEITKGVQMSTLERTLIKAQIRRRKWFPRVTVGAIVVSIYLFRLEIAILVTVSVAAVVWKVLSDPINETEDIMRIRQ
jgi:MFS superfamily sulfate permease-like transporter